MDFVAQGAEHASQLDERGPADPLDGPQAFGRGVLGFELGFAGLGLDDHQGDAVGHHVMDVPTDVRPLLGGSGLGLRLAAAPQFLGLLGELIDQSIARPDDPAGQPEAADQGHR